MGDYSLGQQSQNFSQSTAFAAALQRAKQVSNPVQSIRCVFESINQLVVFDLLDCRQNSSGLRWK